MLSIKSALSAQVVDSDGSSRLVTPVVLTSDQLGLVTGGAPKGGWISTDAPKGGWLVDVSSVDAPKGGWL